MNDLKPCPFCGSEAEIIDYKDEYLEQIVTCRNSFCKVNPNTHFFETREEAIEAWNRRAE